MLNGKTFILLGIVNVEGEGVGVGEGEGDGDGGNERV